MTTPNFISRRLNQKLVYWGNPVDDGKGGFTFDFPVELDGRCIYKMERVVSGIGEETISRAQVYLKQVVTEGGYLYLGTLEDSSLDSHPVPTEVDTSMRILAVEIIPNIQGNAYMYKVYANM